MARVGSAFWRRIPAIAFALVLIAAILCSGWAYTLHLTGNIHEVEPGILYRSGQLSAVNIDNLIKRKHIKSVLNLRGENRGSAWYEAELKTAQQDDVQYINIKMSAIREPDPVLMVNLLTALSSAPTPLLIHCKDGADRTGLAAALYEFSVMHKAPEIADEQLSFRYGHFPWLTSHTDAMDKTFWKFVSSLQPRQAKVESSNE